MRVVNAFFSDMLFMFKQGFFTVYVIVIGIYSVILSFLPDDIAPMATALTVFSDPSVLGLFFIGGVIMLEKGQGVLYVLVTTPLRSREYLLSKILALTVLALLSSFAIAVMSTHVRVNWLLFALSVALTSSFFTMCGVIISASCRNVNEYMLRMVPYMILFVLPCFSLLGFPFSWLFLAIPSVAALKLLLGAYSGISPMLAASLLLYLALLSYLLFRFTLRVFERKIVFND